MCKMEQLRNLLFISLVSVAFCTPLKHENAVPDADSGKGAGRKVPLFLNNTEQSWGYVDVRPGAHMFWWLHKSSHSDGWQNRPLVMWLQGGPGAGSTGYGLFEIIGPYDINGNTREYSWVNEVNVIFVDNPVGAGYSYTDSDDLLTTDVEEIAGDLTQLMRGFLSLNKEFEELPFYIFGQSYGGKMAVAAARMMNAAIEDGGLKMNLKGVAMGNAWIHPVDSTMTWGPFLYWMSNTDEPGLDRIQAAATRCKEAADAGRWAESTQLWRETQWAVNIETNYVDFYNVLKYRVFSKEGMSNLKDKDLWIDYMTGPTTYSLEDFMNNEVKSYLGLPADVEWGKQRRQVFTKQEGDFMKPVVNIIDEMLATTDVQMVVYQGQLDLICDTIGALNWVQRLEWPGLGDYNTAQKKSLTRPEDGQTDLFVKAHNNFKFYWVLRAGHSAPGDSEFSGVRMLQRILGDVDR